MQTGFWFYIKGCSDEDFLQDHTGCSDIRDYREEFINDLGDLGDATVTDIKGNVCTCYGDNCNP